MATGWPMKTTYADGDVYSSQDVNDITGTINLLGSSVAYTAGKNKIINGDFGVWQRGTSFAMAGSGVYTADRWSVAYSGATGATISQYVMTPQELNSFKFGLSFPGTLTDAVNGYNLIRQPIEDVRTLSNQTATVSFYAKGSASGTIGIRLVQYFGTGGSPSTQVDITPQTQAITTTWTRYSLTFTIPSISGKTIGTNGNSVLYVNIDKNIGTGNSIGYGTNPNYTGTLSVTGLQIESGSTATAFQTATGTIQGELAACQRYYFRFTGPGAYSAYAFGAYGGTTTGYILMDYPVTFRTTPSSLDYANLAVQLTDGGGPVAVTNLALDQNSLKNQTLLFTVGSAGTAFRPCRLLNNNNAAGYVGLSAEL